MIGNKISYSNSMKEKRTVIFRFQIDFTGSNFFFITTSITTCAVRHMHDTSHEISKREREIKYSVHFHWKWSLINRIYNSKHEIYIYTFFNDEQDESLNNMTMMNSHVRWPNRVLNYTYTIQHLQNQSDQLTTWNYQRSCN